MTTRDQIHKWFFYALGLFLVWVLDAQILNRLPVLGTIPMLLPLAVVSVAVLEGAYAGAGFGLAVGLLWELAYPGGFGGLVFGMALAGMITGAVSQYALSQSFLSCLLCSAGVLGCWTACGSCGSCFFRLRPWMCCSGSLCRRSPSPCAGPPWSTGSSAGSTGG